MGSSLVDYATASTKVVVAKRRPQIALGAAMQTHGVGVIKNQAAKRRQQKAGEVVSSTAATCGRRFATMLMSTFSRDSLWVINSCYIL
jgi:ATP-dependent protease HslVU (ClpYQ) peptidase subunit